MTASSGSERIDLPLADGVLRGDLNDLLDFLSRSPDLIEQAFTARLETRTALASDVLAHLVDVNGRLSPTWPVAYTLPGGFGRLPYGVPVLGLHSPAWQEIRMWRETVRGQRFPVEEETWVLALSGFPELPIEHAPWNDVDAIARIAARLSDPMDALETQLFLTHPEVIDKPTLADDIARHSAFARRLLDVASDLPPVSLDDVAGLINAMPGYDYEHVRIMDPDLCRYIDLPGIVHITARADILLADLDKQVAACGLVPLKGRLPNMTGTHRYAVASRAGARAIGTLPRYAWWVMSAPFEIPMRRRLFARNGSGCITNVTPLPLDERAAALATFAS